MRDFFQKASFDMLNIKTKHGADRPERAVQRRGRANSKATLFRPRVVRLEDRTLLSFGSPINAATGTAPVSVAVGDFHGDGKLDLAVADNASNQFTLLTGMGDGTFKNFGGTFAVGNKPTAVAVGDFGSPTSELPDGIPDLVVVNSNVTAQGNTLGNFNLFIGDNHGGFTKFIGFNQNISGDFNVGRDPLSVAVEDFNHDGRLDVIVGNDNADVSHSFGTITEYIRRSDGGFDTTLAGANLVSPTFGHPTSLAVADLNGDGFLDIAAASKGDSSGARDAVSLLFNDRFTPGLFEFGDQGFITALSPVSVAVGDFNRDGKPDLVVAFTSGDIVTFSGRGDGTFQNGVFYGPIAAPTSLAVGYFNGDVVQDLAVTSSSNNSVSLLVGNPDGTFQSPVSFGAGSAPASVATGDFNNDGLLDVVTANRASDNVSVLLNRSDTITSLGFSNAAVTRGDPVNLDAFVFAEGPASNNPGGTVTFFVDNNNVGTAALSGGFAQLTVSTGSLSALVHAVSASYSGDALFAASVANNSLTVLNPSPSILSLSATSVSEGGGNLTLTITGSNFVTNSAALANGVSLSTSFIDAGHLGATVPAALVADEGSLGITVVTPPLGGGRSNSMTITVNDAPLTAASVAVTTPLGVVATNVPVATYTDAGGPELVANYTASIDWGDGTAASAGTITLAGTTFTVTGSHTFVAPGRYSPRVTILDKGGSTATTNPATPNAVVGDANERYVSQAYRDVLQRPVDAAGLAFWAGLLDLNQITRVQFAQTLVGSLEYRVLEVQPLYQNFLHRTIDAGGLKFWSDSLAAGLPLEGVKSFIFGSDEYFKLHGSNNDLYLKAVYQDLFNRAIDAGGEQFWLDQMQNHGLTRVNLANAFVRFPEAENSLVTSYYQALLHHAPDAAGLASFSTALQKGTLRDEDVVKALVATDEYFARG